MGRLLFITAIGAIALLGAAVARGEVEADGNLRLGFDARFSPHSLPRDRDVPVTVDVSGTIRTTDGSPPPQLRRITVRVNRYGRMSARGLPTCEAGRLEQTTTEVAMARCRRALVGRGRFGATVGLPSAAPFPVKGEMRAFNGRARGKPAILLHIHGSNPIEATVVLTFEVKRLGGKGRFGTVLTTKIPRIASDLGYVTDVALSFGRRYRFAGEPRSFLSARCAAPDGFPGAIFTLARGSFFFADGKKIVTNVVRDCLVR